MEPRIEEKISWNLCDRFLRIMFADNKSDLIHVADTTYPNWWDNPGTHFFLGGSLLSFFVELGVEQWI